MLSWNWGEEVKEQEVEEIKKYIQVKINKIILDVKI